MILALFVVGGTLALLAWLVFTLAIYALPCFVGVTAGMAAFGAGAGALGAALIGLVVGVLTMVLGHAALAGTRSPFVRLVIATVFIGPAGVAGFGILRDAAHLTGASAGWASVAGVAGAAATMAAALARLTAVPDDARRGSHGARNSLVAHRP